MSATDVPAGRALHLVDLENVIGDPWATGPGVAEVYETVLTTGRHLLGDLVVVAANRWLLAELGFVAHTSCQKVVAHGPDGADLALLAWADAPWIVRRFDRLVVASGDGIFAAVVRGARDGGLEVDVVFGGGAVSNRIRALDAALLPVTVPAKCPRGYRLAAKVKAGRR
jgi:hypothetical protein